MLYNTLSSLTIMCWRAGLAIQVLLVRSTRIRIDYWWNAETTIIHQDMWLGKLVPSSHQRRAFNNTILYNFSRWDQRIREDISIPDSLGEEATFINICISNGVWNAFECWFLPRLVLGIRSSVGILALPLRPLYSSMSIVFPPPVFQMRQ